jgi:hypothetical protein
MCRSAIALALQRMLEEDLYFCMMYCDLQRDDFWAICAPTYSSTLHDMPPMMRPLIMTFARSSLLRDLHGQV